MPQRGHAKSHRTDLRLIGLALMVSADFHIPLFWEVYPGNQPDSVTFSKVLPELARLNPGLAGVTLDDGALIVVFRGIRPAQLAVLPPDIPAALTLRRIP